MKKLLLVACVLLCLSACNIKDKENDANTRYLDMIDLINNYDFFLDSSKHYDIECKVGKIDGGYRFYVTLDNPRNALYDIELLAIEKGVDYSKTMAANVGVFEEKQYSLIPNQENTDKGYVKGVIASGVCERKDVTLYVLVQWKKADMSTTVREFIKLEGHYEEG